MGRVRVVSSAFLNLKVRILEKNLNLGRVTRKANLPLLVKAPKELKVSETVSVEPDNEYEPNTLNRDTLSKQQDPSNTDKDLTTSSSTSKKKNEFQKDRIIGEQMTVAFGIKTRERRVPNEVIFTDNNDGKIFSVFSSGKECETREEPTLNFDDFLPKDITIRPKHFS